jgi:hypothetical protein
VKALQNVYRRGEKEKRREYEGSRRIYVFFILALSPFVRFELGYQADKLIPQRGFHKSSSDTSDTLISTS